MVGKAEKRETRMRLQEFLSLRIWEAIQIGDVQGSQRTKESQK